MVYLLRGNIVFQFCERIFKYIVRSNNLIISFKITYVVLFLLVYATGILVPVYSDEVVTKWNTSRFFIEDGVAVALYPQCSGAVGRFIPYLFYPSAIFMDFLYFGRSPFELRLLGMLIGLVPFVLLFAYILFGSDRLSKVQSSGFFALAIAGLGFLPYLQVIARPEQMLMCGIIFFACYPLVFQKLKSGISVLFEFLVWLLVANLLFFSHPKAIFFAPLVVASGYLTLPNRSKVLAHTFTVYVVSLCVYTYAAAKILSGCTDAPILQESLNANTLSLAILTENPLLFFKLGVGYIIDSPAKILQHVVFSESTQSDWLPKAFFDNQFFIYLNASIKLILFSLIALGHAMPFILLTLAFWNKKFDKAVFVSVMLTVGSLATAFLVKNWNFYGAVVPIATSLLNLIILKKSFRSLVGKLAIVDWGLRLMSFVVLIVSFSSLLFIIFHYTNNLLYRTLSKFPVMDDQELSIPAVGSETYIRGIRDLGESCGIKTMDQSNLVVDTMSYFAYQNVRHPLHILYIGENGFGGDIQGSRLIEFIANRGSPGIIAQCKWLPEAIRYSALRGDFGYCCISLK